MINPTGKKLEKLLFGMFDDAIQGVDRYNHNGCLWLIFTDEMRWVVEYTKTQTLWYNFYFFKQEMEMVGLDCVDNKDLIQKWFESRFLNINPVEYTRAESFHFNRQVEDTIQNGVKETCEKNYRHSSTVEDTIQNGVKETRLLGRFFQVSVEDTIQNGVKQTELSKRDFFPEDIFQNGVKNTYSDKIPHEYDWSDQFTEEIEDTIQNGVKETCKSESTKSISLRRTIQNGVKNTNEAFYGQVYVEDTVQNGVKHCEDGDRLDGDYRFEDIIQNGVKEINEENHHRRRDVINIIKNI
jgi:hypothetical protein